MNSLLASLKVKLRRATALACLILLGFCCVSPAIAAIETYEFDDEADRKRYQHFLDVLRCPKCKNNNLAGTNSQIAIDLRRELYKLVTEDKSDEEIIDFMVTRYGDFVLYEPPLQGNTIALWFGPIIFLGIGATVIGFLVWRRRRFVGRKVELTAEERSQLDKMLSKKK